MDDDKSQVVERIVEIEVDMFLRVPTDREPSCRVHPEEMKLHRRGQFAGWSIATCASSLQDLGRARAAGVNLMTIKYARIDNLIPPVSTNPRIKQVRERFVGWQAQVIARYPHLMGGARDLADFSRYLEAELATYSYRTRELLFRDVEECLREGGNISLAVYGMLAQQTGYSSLEDMEEMLR